VARQRVALVTGGSRGIGRGIAEALARGDVRVALTYQQESAKAAEVAAGITKAGGTAVALSLIVEDRGSVKRAMESVQRSLGPIDILVNNAAIAQEKPFPEITDADWDRMLAVNLRGPFACSQEVIPGMLERKWGRIVNISSIGGQWGGMNQVHYAVAKAGLNNLTRSLAKLYSARGITSNTVAIGLVQTDMSGPELDTPAGREKVRNIPVGRVATVDEVANVVAFLASEEASYVTGQTINVNGGMYFG
jgi:NAD(P)-dependent dehydrogenase (short-subunit alcohol dehydrogenase family)